MSKPIRIGDLVMVVRGRACGCESPCDGLVFVVSDMYRGQYQYNDCGHRSYRELGATDGRYLVELSRLQRIDPPAELEGTNETRELETQ